MDANPIIPYNAVHEARKHFVAVTNEYLGSLTDESLINEVASFLTVVLGSYEIESMSTPIDTVKLSRRVFERTAVRNTVMELTFLFRASWAPSDKQMQELRETFARAATFTATGTMGNSLVPQEISQRLGTYDELLNVFAANDWLLTIYMLKAYGMDIIRNFIKGLTRK